MLNIISEDSLVNCELQEFPSSQANIAIFGSQSSGKSTLVNAAFGTTFPVLDTKKARHRCTRGVWYQHSNNLNIIDTEGFDSNERHNDERIFQKHISLLCLALADVILINLWMNEIGRYSGTHTHILRAIVKVSERLVSSQQKKIIFVVKDCTGDAQASVLKEELSTNINQIIKEEAKKGVIKFNIEYHFMSHYFYKQKEYLAEAKELRTLIKVKKPFLNVYTNQQRAQYIRKIWDKIQSHENEIDLKSVEDALKSHAMESLSHTVKQLILQQVSSTFDLAIYKTYERYIEHFHREISTLIKAGKAGHMSDKDVKMLTEKVQDQLNSQLILHFKAVILPEEEEQLMLGFTEKALEKEKNSKKIEKIILQKKKKAIETHRKILKGNHELNVLSKRFSDRITAFLLRYERRANHLFNLFESKLQKELYRQIDQQLKTLHFNEAKITAKVKDQCKQFDYNKWEVNLKEIWEKVVHRAVENRLPEKILEESNQFMQSASIFQGDRTPAIVAFHKKLQKQAQQFCKEMLLYCDPDASTAHPIDKIKQHVKRLLSKSLTAERKRFHLTYLLVGIFLVFMYGEFLFLLKSFPMKKKRRRIWINNYWLFVFAMFAISAYQRREQIEEAVNKVKDSQIFDSAA